MFVFESLVKCEFARFLQWRHEKRVFLILRNMVKLKIQTYVFLIESMKSYHVIVLKKSFVKQKEVFMKNKIETSKSSTAFYYRLRYFMTIKDLDNYDKLSEASGLCRGNMATCLHHPERMNITKFKALISTLEVDREDTLEWLCQFLWGEDLATTVDKLKK